jgi:hypothetical protein
MFHEPAFWSSSSTSVNRISSWISTSSMFLYDILTVHYSSKQSPTHTSTTDTVLQLLTAVTWACKTIYHWRLLPSVVRITVISSKIVYSSASITPWEYRPLDTPQHFIIIIFSGMRLSPLGIGLLYQPQTMDDSDCEAVDGMKIDRGNRSTRRKLAPVLLCPPQIPHDLTQARTRATAVGNQRLTVWTMALPSSAHTTLPCSAMFPSLLASEPLGKGKVVPVFN